MMSLLFFCLFISRCRIPKSFGFRILDVVVTFSPKYLYSQAFGLLTSTKISLYYIKVKNKYLCLYKIFKQRCCSIQFFSLALPFQSQISSAKSRGKHLHRETLFYTVLCLTTLTCLV